jgi:cholesterol transport system auxiliary component
MKRRQFQAGAAALLLGGCSLAPTQPAVAVFDFGPAPAAAPGGVALRVLAVAAPPWLDGPEIGYRLAYRDPYRREAYRDSRWAASPAALLGARLQARAGPGSGAAATLALQLDDFSQVFSAPTQSRVLLRLRARLSPAGQPDAALERVIELERTAPTADAAGAVRALSQAADEAVAQLLAWAAAP